MVENAFGILAFRFRCLLVTLRLTPQRVIKVAHACCVLHNFLRQKNSRFSVASVDAEDPQSNHEIIPGSWRQDAQLPDMKQCYRGNTNKAAKNKETVY